MKKMCLFILLAVAATPLLAGIRLPAVIGSNMVLQQQSHPKLWGWCDPGEKIYVTTSWDHRKDSVRGSRDGKWMIEVATPSAGGPYTIELKGWNQILLENVMIGEVWICSGQSNMEMSETWGLPDVRAELPSCATNDIHFFHVPRTTAGSPQEDCKADWTACDSTQLKFFSAVGYFFAKRLNQELHVPVGMIEVAWSGTPAEVWTPAELVTGDSVLKQAAAQQKPSGGWPYLPGYCYNGMITPITSYDVAGVIWYQGEGNTAAPKSYSRLFTTMIGAWRKAWNKPLPFYFVQIAPFTYGTPDQGSLVREQQTATLRLEHTGMVVVSDLVTDTADIHPKNKHDVGYRLANWALADTYHREGIVFASPMFSGLVLKGNKVEVSFSHAGSGLEVKGPAVQCLMVAGEDRVFYPAKAKIEGSKMIVSASEVKKPVAVRYQFSNAGIGNVFSKEGLPLAPFRTDDW